MYDPRKIKKEKISSPTQEQCANCFTCQVCVTKQLASCNQCVECQVCYTAQK